MKKIQDFEIYFSRNIDEDERCWILVYTKITFLRIIETLREE